MKNKSKINISLIIGILVLCSVFSIGSKKVQANSNYFTLVALVSSGNENLDYLNLIKQQLAEIGIALDMKLTSWPNWYYYYGIEHRYDLGIIYKKDSKAFDPDFSDLYSENASFYNWIGYHTEIDYNSTLGTGKNEWYLNQGKIITPTQSEERVNHYRDWQQYMMDELLLCQPMFTWKSYQQCWDTLEGYDFSDGLLQSWGKMSWSAPHFGQERTDEIVINKRAWSDLNPLIQSDLSSEFITDAILDPLFWIDSDKSIHPHLASDFEMFNDTYCRLYLREGIKWQSDPDGNFTNEYFDAEDVYLSLTCWAKLSEYHSRFRWLEEMKIIDPYTIDIFIDGNPETAENEPEGRFLEYLAIEMLPEHYLNQTQQINDLPNTNHTSWEIFNINCFGTGLFQYTDFVDGYETILTVNPESWWLNSTIANDSKLDWINRFGNFTGGLNRLRIKGISDPYAIYDYYEGEIDISPESEEIPPQSDNHRLFEKLQPNLKMLVYNVDQRREYIANTEPCSSDPSISKGLAIRKAISYAINRDEFNTIIFGGKQTKTDYPIYESLGIWCNPNIIKYNYDLEKAKYYMELAGYTETILSGFELRDYLYLSFVILISAVIIRRKKEK